MKRLAALALAVLLLVTAGGCATLFDREIYTEEPYEAPAEALYTEEDAADSISSYAALRRAIARLVSEHVESAELQFQNYDGSISQDISTACWEVKSSTALGAFAVDYISYDLSRIVSYYQAEIYITYKRSDYQVSALERLENVAAMRARLEQALRAGETYLVLELTAASVTADAVSKSVERAYYADPLACPVLPSVEAVLYPESGVDRIIEVTMDYGLDGESLAQRREELAAAVDAAALACAAPEGQAEGAADSAAELAPTERLAALCAYLAAVCVPSETAGGTAWDALAAGSASSEGFAMALEAVCQAMGIECLRVSGRLDGEPHAWNIVTLEGGSYHVDAARWAAGDESAFLAGDEDLWGAYWWDTSEYPACPVSYTEAPASGEPSEDTPSGEPTGQTDGEGWEN